MSAGSSGATALLGMDGFVVLAMIEEDGELFISVETTATVAGCGSCGVRATGHGRSVIQMRDLPRAADRSGWCGGSGSGSVGTPTVHPSRSPKRVIWSRTR